MKWCNHVDQIGSAIPLNTSFHKREICCFTGDEYEDAFCGVDQLMMTAVSSSETSVNTNHSTRCKIPEGIRFYTRYFIVNLRTLTVATIKQSPMTEWLVHNKLKGTHGSKRLWPNLRYYHGIFLAELRKTTKNLGHDSRSAGLNLNPSHPKSETGVENNSEIQLQN